MGLKTLPWQRLFKFAVTGGVALLIDAAIYFVLTRFGHVPYLLSRTVSLSLAMIWNFTINRIWTFEAKGGNASRQAVRFLTVMVITSLISLGLMRVGVSYLQLNDLLVLLTVSLLIMMLNFSAHQLWSYRG